MITAWGRCLNRVVLLLRGNIYFLPIYESFDISLTSKSSANGTLSITGSSKVYRSHYMVSDISLGMWSQTPKTRHVVR